jgi:hypothetical protein
MKMSDDTIIISIIYEEFEKDSYERVEVCCGDITIQFHCGDVIEDFKEAKRFSMLCYENENVIGKIEHIMLSSSVDHFVQDTDYEWKEDSMLGSLIIKEDVKSFEVIVKTSEGDWNVWFREIFTVKELIEQVRCHFGYVEDGHYEMYYKGCKLDKGNTFEDINLKDGDILDFSDLGDSV